MSHSATSSKGDGERAHRAGLFDIRIFIGGLLGIYGVILTLTGLIGTDSTQLAKSNNFNINLVGGIAMIIASAIFIAWARLRPVVVSAQRDDSDEERRVNEG
jgi:hypothetical protein